MQFLTDTKPDIVITNYSRDILIGIKYSADVCSYPWICLKAGKNDNKKDNKAMINALYDSATADGIYSCVDLGLIYLLKDLEVGECIPKDISQPVAAALAQAYCSRAEQLASGKN